MYRKLRMKAIRCSLLLISVMLLLAACSQEKDKKTKQPVLVEKMDVSASSSENGDEYVGTVAAGSGTVLSFEVPGNISLLKVDEGDRVVKGQLLARVSPVTLKEAHYATVVTLNQARDAYRRMKPLHAKGVISEIRWVDVESKLRQAEAAERIAREQLGHTGLYAPFSGVISSKTAEIGMNVIAGQQVYKLVDVSKVNIEFSVPEDEISHIHTGMHGHVTVKALGGDLFSGIVSEKGVVADPVSHTYNVKMAISNPDGRLMPGMVCSVKVNAVVDADSKITVPLSAVELDTDNSKFVWVVVGHRAQQRKVCTGKFAEGGWVVITSGLEYGDCVIVGGAQKVSQGMTVKVK